MDWDDKSLQQPSTPSDDAREEGASPSVTPEKGKSPSIKDVIETQTKQWRRKAIEITPGFIVNNSSNIIGAGHLATEMMMFKSGMGKDSKLLRNPGNPINWIKEPIQTVFTETFRRAEVHGLHELLQGNVFKNLYRRIVDMDAAVARFHARPENVGKNAKLLSPWQFRTTFAGLVAWSLTTFIPEQKSSDEEIERMSIKRRVDPVGYVGERLKQAVWVPEWHKHKRQMLGLAYLVIGICSTIGSWRGRTKNLRGEEKYTFNLAYLATSILSLLGGVPLLFASDEQRGYGSFGAIMLGRIPFLFGSISDKYKKDDPGKNWYAASSVSFQVENLVQALIGGAQKLPDGTIVDHTLARELAKEKVEELKVAPHSSLDVAESPTMRVLPDRQVERAMPTAEVANSNLLSA